MAVFRLSEELIFPDPELADEDGLLAIGGDLTPERLLLAYRMGIFPWFSDGDPILWWSPKNRSVILDGQINVNKSTKKIIKKSSWEVGFDENFEEVINYCSELRKDNTWILKDIISSYTTLHRLGFAHSVEVKEDNILIGGLYGVSIGKSFFGESMFSLKPNSSKVALIFLVKTLFNEGYKLIDCQIQNPHLKKMGSVEIKRSEFLKILNKNNSNKTNISNWNNKKYEVKDLINFI